MRLAEKYSLTKATKKAGVALLPTSLNSCGAVGAAKVAIHKPLRMPDQPSEKRRVHRKVNIAALKDLKAKCLDLSVQRGLHIANCALRLLPSDKCRTTGKSTDFTGHGSCNSAEGVLGVALATRQKFDRSQAQNVANQLVSTVRMPCWESQQKAPCPKEHRQRSKL